MQAAIQEIQDILSSNGGEMEWEALVNATSFQNRRYFADAIKHLRSTGTVKRSLTWDAENKQNRLVIVTL